MVLHSRSPWTSHSRPDWWCLRVQDSSPAVLRRPQPLTAVAPLHLPAKGALRPPPSLEATCSEGRPGDGTPGPAHLLVTSHLPNDSLLIPRTPTPTPHLNCTQSTWDPQNTRPPGTPPPAGRGETPVTRVTRKYTQGLSCPPAWWGGRVRVSFSVATSPRLCLTRTPVAAFRTGRPRMSASHPSLRHTGKDPFAHTAPFQDSWRDMNFWGTGHCLQLGLCGDAAGPPGLSHP